MRHYTIMMIITLRIPGFATLCRECGDSEGAVQFQYKGRIACEQLARTYARRNFMAAREIPSGQVITEEMLGIKRPGTGISPEFIDLVCGRKVRCDITEGAVLRWEDLT